VRVLVFGAGAIGSFLGHRLVIAGHDVTLIGRPAYVRAAQERGLILEEQERGKPAVATSIATLGDGTTQVVTADHFQERGPALYGRAVYPAAAESIGDLPTDQRSWDLILVTVKVYDTAKAAQALAPYLAMKAPILIVQNGVGGEELAQGALPQATVISGVLTLSVSVVAPAHIRLETSRGGLSLAPTQVGQDIWPWAELFAAAGLGTATYTDYHAMKWTKLLLNIQANAIPAILDVAPDDVYAHPALFVLERAAFREALAVMRALHLRVVSFPNYPVPLLAWAMQHLPSGLLRPLLARLVASGRGDKKPSLQMDLAAGRQQSEALYLNGAVVSYAERLGVQTPVNRALLDTLLGIAAGRIPWDEFRGQPEKLLRELEISPAYPANNAGRSTEDAGEYR
jgi:2-dehydropantoate 2-reductase